MAKVLRVRLPHPLAVLLQGLIGGIRSRLLFYALFMLLGLWTFVEVAANVVTRDEITVYDAWIVKLLNMVADPAATRFFLTVTYLGGEWLWWIFAGTFLLLTVFRRRLEAGLLALSTGGGLLLVLAVKNLLDRERPVLDAPVHLETGFSFPSGHTTVSFCFYGFLTYLLCRQRRSPWLWLVMVLILALVVGAIGLSRVYLGVHYPSDVLAGVSLGLLWTSLCAWIYHWRQGKPAKD